MTSRIRSQTAMWIIKRTWLVSITHRCTRRPSSGGQVVRHLITLAMIQAHCLYNKHMTDTDKKMVSLVGYAISVTQQLKPFYTETSIMILTQFNESSRPWIFLSPTVHGLLHHSAELIASNDGFGLLEYSESGLEANNKFLRFYRTFLARKTGQVQNLTDVFTRMWLKSDPCIKAASIKTQTKRKTQKTNELPLSKEQQYMNILIQQW